MRLVRRMQLARGASELPIELRTTPVRVEGALAEVETLWLWSELTDDVWFLRALLPDGAQSRTIALPLGRCRLVRPTDSHSLSYWDVDAWEVLATHAVRGQGADMIRLP